MNESNVRQVYNILVDHCPLKNPNHLRQIKALSGFRSSSYTDRSIISMSGTITEIIIGNKVMGYYKVEVNSVLI